MTRKRVPRVPVALETRVITGSGGGPDKTILNSPRFLARAGYRTVCAYMHPPGDPGFEQLRRKAEAWQAPLVSIPDRGPWDLAEIGHYLDLCRRERVQIWHAHDYKSNLLGLLLRRFWPMRLLTTVHGWGRLGPRTPLYFWIDRRCLPYYDRVICVSPDLFEQCRASGVPAERCELIENAVDTEEFSRHQTAAEAKSRLGVPADRLLIGAVARLSAEKCFDTLIRSVDHLLKTGLNVELAIVGDGEEAERLKALIAELGRGDRVHLLGFRSDTRAVYEALDVFALCSIREGLPNVLLEAMAMEVPVVATRIAGIPRLIQNEENGLLIEPGSGEALTEALARLVQNSDLRDRLRRAGRQTIETKYSFAARMEKIKAIYDDLLGRQAVAPEELPSEERVERG